MNIPSWISTPSPTKTWKQSNSGFYILWIGFWFYSLEEGIECYHTCIPKKWTAYRKRQPNLCSKCFKEKTTTTVVATFPLSQVSTVDKPILVYHDANQQLHPYYFSSFHVFNGCHYLTRRDIPTDTFERAVMLREIVMVSIFLVMESPVLLVNLVSLHSQQLRKHAGDSFWSRCLRNKPSK